MMRLRPSFLAGILILPLAALAQDPLVRSVRYLPPTYNETQRNIKRVALFCDRKVYWNDDNVGQFLLLFLGEDVKGKPVTVEVLGEGDVAAGKRTFGPMKEPKAELLIAVGALQPGAWRVRATLAGEKPVVAEVAFQRENKQNPAVTFPPDGIPIEVEPQSHLAETTWPICAGIPFPYGLLADVSRLVLTEDGKPVPCQIEKISTWRPEGEGVASSIRWVHLNFAARYKGGKPAEYRLKMQSAPRVHSGPRVAVAETDAAVTVDTGRVRFVVNKKTFNGIETAWFDRNGDKAYTDDEKTLEAVKGLPAGPYVQDQRTVTFEAANDAEAQVVVEESGPFRAVIAAKGWLVNPKLSDQAGKRLCQFVTRLYAYADRPEIRVDHRTIVTFDTDQLRLLDVGFALPTVKAAQWSVGLDGQARRGDLIEKGEPVFLHQYRWDRARIGNVPVTEKGRATLATVEGGRSDGWCSLIFGKGGDDIADPRVALSVLVKDIWRKYPKEVELSAEGLNVHAWPKHGMRTFTHEEMYARSEIYKLRWHHQGKLLDLRFPSDAYEILKDYNAASGTGLTGQWDSEGMSEQALNGSAQGVAMASEFVLRFHSAAEDMAPPAQLWQQDPHARAEGRWNAATLAEGRIAPRDPARYPEVEAELDSAHTAYLRTVVEATNEYGMWIYGGTHNKFAPEAKMAYLHRVWQASHYRHVWTPWLLYFRGTPFPILRWARANTDRFMDVETVNYADPENAPIKAHLPGAMYHAKGFTPWGATRYGQPVRDAYVGVQGHWINADAFLIRYYLEGSRRARDLHLLWGQSIKRYGVWPGVSREVNNTANEIFALYQSTWDPDLLSLMNFQVENMMGAPLSKWPHSYHHPWFNPIWFARLHDMTRDPRIVPALVQYRADGFPGCQTMHAMIWRETGDKSVLDLTMPAVYNNVRTIYRNPGDPLDGYGSRIADPYTFHQQVLYWMQALNEAGVPGVGPGDAPPLYPATATHPQYIPSEPSALMLAAWDRDDREIHIKLESRFEMYRPYLRVLSPSGKIVQEYQDKTPGATRFKDDQIVRLKVPADGEKGIYRLDFRNWEGCWFDLPVTDAPLEAALMSKGADHRTFYRSDAHWMPTGKTPAATLEIRAMIYREATDPAYVRVADARDKVMLETTLLFSSQRPSAQVALDPARNPAPYRVTLIGNVCSKWTGAADAMVIATDPAAATKMAGLIVP